jgi:hypothetical protein
MRGPCAKRRITCDLMTAEGPTFHGTNDCDNAQEICPRAPGEGYEKCASICQQGAHAEIDALNAALRCGYEAKDAVAIIQGHYYICEPCGRALRDAGVRMVKIVLAA